MHWFSSISAGHHVTDTVYTIRDGVGDGVGGGLFLKGSLGS